MDDAEFFVGAITIIIGCPHFGYIGFWAVLAKKSKKGIMIFFEPRRHRNTKTQKNTMEIFYDVVL